MQFNPVSLARNEDGLRQKQKMEGNVEMLHVHRVVHGQARTAEVIGEQPGSFRNRVNSDLGISGQFMNSFTALARRSRLIAASQTAKRQERSHDGCFLDVEKTCIIDPNSRFRYLWDCFCIYFVVYTALVLPFRVAFDQPACGFWDAHEKMMDVVFILDFFLNCITAYVDKDQLLVISHFAIAKHYVKTWAIIDLASAIPFDMILEPDSIHISSCTTGNDISPEAPNKLLRAGRVAKVMRLLRLLRLGKLGLAFKKLSMYTDIRWGVIRILQFGTSVLLVCHVLACFWMLVPRLDNFERPSWATTTTIGDTDIKDTNYWTQYIYCLYWAITTMSTIGYGDVTPKNEVETSVCIVAMLVGSAVFAYGITTLCEIVANLSLRDVFYHQQADMMLEMLRYMNIGNQIRIYQYLFNMSFI